MKSEIIENNGLKRTLKVQVSADEVSSALDTEFQKIQKSTHLKGFRKGKAPMDQIKSMYGGQASQKVLEELVNQNYIQALGEHDLRPIAMPDIKLDEKAEDEESKKGGFTFTAQFEVRPEIEIKDLSQIKVEQAKVEVTEEQVSQVIEQARAAQAEVVALEEDRPAQEKDWVKVDFSGYLPEKGEEVQNGSAQDFLLELGSKSLIEGFEEGIIGMKVGEEKKLTLSFPKDYFQADLAAAPVEFTVKLNSLNTKKFPELNDEFAKKVSGLDSLEDYKKKVREDLEASEKQKADNQLTASLLGEFEKMHDIEVPSSIVEEQTRSFKATTEQRLKQQGMNEASIKEYHEKWEENYAKEARTGVKTSFLVEALASKENLYPNKEDLQEYFADIAGKTNIDLETIKAYYSSEQKQSELEFKLMEEKVVAFLKDKATITEA